MPGAVLWNRVMDFAFFMGCRLFAPPDPAPGWGTPATVSAICPNPGSCWCPSFLPFPPFLPSSPYPLPAPPSSCGRGCVWLSSSRSWLTGET